MRYITLSGQSSRKEDTEKVTAERRVDRNGRTPGVDNDRNAVRFCEVSEVQTSPAAGQNPGKSGGEVERH